MGVKSTALAEEDLTPHVYPSSLVGARLYEPRHLEELAPERRIWKHGGEDWINTGERLACLKSTAPCVARGPDQLKVKIHSSQLIE